MIESPKSIRSATSLNNGCLPVAGFCNLQAAAASQRQFQTKVATDGRRDRMQCLRACSHCGQDVRGRLSWHRRCDTVAVEGSGCLAGFNGDNRSAEVVQCHVTCLHDAKPACNASRRQPSPLSPSGKMGWVGQMKMGHQSHKK